MVLCNLIFAVKASNQQEYKIFRYNNFTAEHSNRNLEISRAPKTAESWEPAYPQMLSQNKIE